MHALIGAATAQQTSETRAVDARVLKVRLGGVIDLHVKQGASASLVIAGDQKYVSKVITTQQGDTLHIDIENNRHTHFGTNNKQQLRADAVDLGMTGLGSASVYAKTSATLSLSGMGSATVYGKPPNRKASSSGLGSVSWQ